MCFWGLVLFIFFKVSFSVGRVQVGGMGGGGVIITFLPCRPMRLGSWLSSVDVTSNMSHSSFSVVNGWKTWMLVLQLMKCLSVCSFSP